MKRGEHHGKIVDGKKGFQPIEPSADRPVEPSQSTDRPLEFISHSDMAKEVGFDGLRIGFLRLVLVGDGEKAVRTVPRAFENLKNVFCG